MRCSSSGLETHVSCRINYGAESMVSINQSTMLNSPCRGVSQFAGSLTEEYAIGDPALRMYMDMLKTNNTLNSFVNSQGQAVGSYSNASSVYLWNLAICQLQ